MRRHCNFTYRSRLVDTLLRRGGCHDMLGCLSLRWGRYGDGEALLAHDGRGVVLQHGRSNNQQGTTESEEPGGRGEGGVRGDTAVIEGEMFTQRAGEERGGRGGRESGGE